jgi:ubiquinone/menaquinone biosynthesis C-methylase UbiE
VQRQPDRPPLMREEISIQRDRYARIADQYEQVHNDPEHVVALSLLRGMLAYLHAESLLDVGAGTGRTIKHLRCECPDVRIMGVEPVEQLRAVGHRHGLPSEILVEGDGYNLQFPDCAFDVVCEFGMLHHVREPNRVVAEMLRVARKAVFLSDSNNFGGGSTLARLAKQCFHQLGLWPAVNYVKTGGKGYSITEGDGLFYSYSVFDSMDLLRRHCRIIHMLNTTPARPNLYRTANHLAVFAIKS